MSSALRNLMIRRAEADSGGALIGGARKYERKTDKVYGQSGRTFRKNEKIATELESYMKGMIKSVPLLAGALIGGALIGGAMGANINQQLGALKGWIKAYLGVGSKSGKRLAKLAALGLSPEAKQQELFALMEEFIKIVHSHPELALKKAAKKVEKEIEKKIEVEGPVETPSVEESIPNLISFEGEGLSNKLAAAKNPWLQHVAAIRATLPKGTPQSEVVKIARTSYVRS